MIMATHPLKNHDYIDVEFTRTHVDLRAKI
jgi:hypothetical protein